MRCLPAGVLLFVIGCGQGPKAEMVPLEDVPEKLMTVARDKLPEVNFEQAVKRPDGVYEIGGKDSRGKVREIELTEDGEIVEIE
jgi:hypothetical protein